MLLLYCMTQDDAPLPCSGLSGIGGAEVRDVAKNGVRYYFSDWDPAVDTQAVKEQALAFHQLNQLIFEYVTIIPFRFPTSVANEQKLSELMESSSSEYAQELVRLRDTVQMKVMIESSDSPAGPPATTGKEYLQQRQRASAPAAAAIKAVQSAVGEMARGTKQSRRMNAELIFLLIDREKVDGIRQTLSLIPHMQARVSVSGPWPPSEFVNCYPDLTQAKRL